jgi:glycosyltransferase involved in cell wall biosynthesis
MRIAQVAPLAESVPPKLYGGTERVVSWLTEELVDLGHDVTLFASGDSVTRAKLVSSLPRALRLSRPHGDAASAYAALLEAVAEQAAAFDVIHCHVDWIHLPLLRRLEIPFLTTLHGRLDLPQLAAVAQRFEGAPFVSISNGQRNPVPNINWVGTVYHGLPPNGLAPIFQPDHHLAFLGRIAPEKGPDVAIRWARAAGLPIWMAAKVPRRENRFFNERIAPFVDGHGVKFVGEVDDSSKAAFLGRAKALLFPINWPEPFGLVMIEAMACGTPVIAFPCGSVPEIIEDGVTGFIVENDTQAVQAIGRLDELDRRRVRAQFERRFSASRMAQDYLRCYRMLMSNAAEAAKSVDAARGELREVQLAPP